MTINLEPIKDQLAKDIGGYICLHRDDMAGLVSELEHLRGDRAAVVAWLRDNEDAWSMPTWQLADAIERGEHRREEKP